MIESKDQLQDFVFSHRDSLPAMLANPFLFPSRRSCENPSIQELSPTWLMVIVNLLFSGTKSLLILFLGAVTPRQLRIQEQKALIRFKESSGLDSLLISHLMSADWNEQNDATWGKVLNELRSRVNFSLFFLNHTRINPTALKRSINKNNPSISFLISPKVAPLWIQVKCFADSLIQLIRLCRFANTINGSGSITIKLWFQLIISQLHHRTMRNLFFAEVILQEVVRKKYSYIFMTIEGNSHEQYIVHRIRKLQPSIRFVLYQHAPIVEAQPGLHLLLTQISKSDFVLTTCDRYRNIFIKMSASLDTTNTFTLGSNRAISSVFPLDAASGPAKTDPHFLFVPEGTECATLEMVLLAKMLHKFDFSNEIVLRLHPHLAKSWKIRRQLRELPMSVHISSRSLADDLVAASHCFYRTTSISSYLDAYGVIPVYVNLSGARNLNPLSLFGSGLVYEICSTVELEEFINGLRSFKPQKKSGKTVDLFFEEYHWDALNFLSI